jgi:hypothetical protein
MALEFNDEQQQALNRNARRAEAQRLTPIMRKNMPEQTERFTDDKLEQSIMAALERTVVWQVQTRSASIDFVILWLVLGPNFDDTFEIKDFFRTGPASSIDAKIEALMSEFKWKLHQEEGQ